MGPASRYTLDLHHLVERPLGWLVDAQTLDAGLKENFAQADSTDGKLDSSAGLGLIPGRKRGIRNLLGWPTRATVREHDAAPPRQTGISLVVGHDPRAGRVLRGLRKEVPHNTDGGCIQGGERLVQAGHH